VLRAEPETVNFGNVQATRIANPTKYKLNIRNISAVDLVIKIRLEDEKSKEYFGVSYLKRDVFIIF
jgi:hypothetical protein